MLEQWLHVALPLYTRQPLSADALARSVMKDEVRVWFNQPGGEAHSFNLKPGLERVRCPTLVMGGTLDPMTPIECQRDIAAALPANLVSYEAAAVKTEASLGLLNIGQSAIIAIAATLLMVLAAQGVASKALTIGDLVLINALLIQLYIPLNFLGMAYREIKQSLIDMDRMFRLLEENREVQDAPGALPLPEGPAAIRFENVNFSYDPRGSLTSDGSRAFVYDLENRLKC